MRYTAQEIHRMRQAVGDIWGAEHNGMSYFDRDRQQPIETRLVTYMANGTTPDELEAEATRMLDALFEKDRKQAQVPVRWP